MLATRMTMMVVGLMAFSTMACGGTSKRGGEDDATFLDTGIARGTKAGELTQAQSQELCDAVEAAAVSAYPARELHEVECGFEAWSKARAAETPDQCQALYDECMKRPATLVPSMTDGECVDFSDACVATVGEIEKCMSDVVAQQKALLAAMPGCDDVGNDMAPDDEPNEMPASCKIVEQKCSEAFTLQDEPEQPTDGANDSASPPPASKSPERAQARDIDELKERVDATPSERASDEQRQR